MMSQETNMSPDESTMGSLSLATASPSPLYGSVICVHGGCHIWPRLLGMGQNTRDLSIDHVTLSSDNTQRDSRETDEGEGPCGIDCTGGTRSEMRVSVNGHGVSHG
jgi:hypothetical protein